MTPRSTIEPPLSEKASVSVGSGPMPSSVQPIPAHKHKLVRTKVKGRLAIMRWANGEVVPGMQRIGIRARTLLGRLRQFHRRPHVGLDGRLAARLQPGQLLVDFLHPSRHFLLRQPLHVRPRIKMLQFRPLPRIVLILPEMKIGNTQIQRVIADLRQQIQELRHVNRIDAVAVLDDARRRTRTECRHPAPCHPALDRPFPVQDQWNAAAQVERQHRRRHLHKGVRRLHPVHALRHRHVRR